MYAGRIIETGPVEAVTRAPRHPYTRGLMASIPSMRVREADLHQIDGSMPRLTAIPAGCAFNPRCEMSSDRCRTEKPVLEARAHAVACWHPIEGDPHG